MPFPHKTNTVLIFFNQKTRAHTGTLLKQVPDDLGGARSMLQLPGPGTLKPEHFTSCAIALLKDSSVARQLPQCYRLITVAAAHQIYHQCVILSCLSRMSARSLLCASPSE